jgi:hypothetical protein
MSPAKTAKKMLASFDIGSPAPSRRRVTLPLIPEHKGLDSPGLWRRSATETLNTCKTWGDVQPGPLGRDLDKPGDLAPGYEFPNRLTMTKLWVTRIRLIAPHVWIPTRRASCRRLHGFLEHSSKVLTL